MSELTANSIVEWRGEDMEITSIERVLWMSSDRSTLVVIDILNLTSDPIERSYQEVIDALYTPYVKLLELDPYAKFLSPSEEFLQKHSAKRDKAWNVIKDIVDIEPDIYDGRRGKLITDVCEQRGKSRKVVLQLLRKYWIRGKLVNALLPEFDNCGARGKSRPAAPEGQKRGRHRDVTLVEPDLEGVNVTENDLKNIRIALNTFYNKSAKHPLKTAWDAMVRTSYNIGFYLKEGKPVPIPKPAEDIPSLTQFRYHARKMLDLEDSLKKRLGLAKYQKDYRHLKGNSITSGPGAQFQIDATVADAYLISSFDPNRIIGRPVVYIVKDVFTRLVTGVYVGLEGPSWVGAMMALLNTTQDKVEFCAQFRIGIEDWEWPSHHLPKVLLADRGELESSKTDFLTQNLGVRVDNAPPYRADLKGIVEQHFRMLNLKLGPFIPGAIRKEFRERGEPDYRLHARLTIEAFTRCIIRAILLHNKTEIKDYPLTKEMWQDGVAPIPVELWQWGVANASGYLVERSKTAVMLNLMPRAEASLTQQGLYFQKMYYSVDDSLLKGWNEKLHGRKKFTICYDPRNSNYVYIPTEDGSGYLICELKEYFDRFKGYRIEEVQDQLFYERVESAKRASSQMQIQAETDTLNLHDVEEASREAEAQLDPSMSNAQRTSQIRENRKEERENIRRVEAFNLAEEQDAPSEPDTPLGPEAPEEQYTSNRSALLSKIKETRDKRRGSNESA